MKLCFLNIYFYSICVIILVFEETESPI